MDEVLFIAEANITSTQTVSHSPLSCLTRFKFEMGKHGKRKIGGYEHVHTYNPKARESNERKMSNMQAIAIRRYQGYVDKIRNNMYNYVPAEQRLKQKPGEFCC